jgi:hypothetical protein
MSFSDDTRSFTLSFQHTKDLLELLLAALKARRAAWVSARPSTLAPSHEIEQLTQEIAREESARDELLARIRLALPAPFGHPASVSHMNATRIAAALPAPEAQALRDVAAVVQRLAKAVRTEVTLGQRLVRFAQSAALAPLAVPPAAAPGYDRDARAVRAGKFAGAIVDGRV